MLMKTIAHKARKKENYQRDQQSWKKVIDRTKEEEKNGHMSFNEIEINEIIV